VARGLLPDRSKAVEGGCIGRDARAGRSGQELTRCVRELGFVGVAVAGHSAGRNLDHPDFYPFYAKAEELGVPVCVHVGSGRPAAAAERFDNPFFVHATTHAFEQMIGVMCIVGAVFSNGIRS